MSFITDTSTQINNSLTPSDIFTSPTTPNISVGFTSGIYNPSANVIKIFTNNTDALTIDGNQYLYGNATGLTNLNYNAISNKPSLFSGSYNDLSGKPSLFSGAYNDLSGKPDLSVYATTTALSSKENALTFSAPLTRTTNTISLDLSSYITTTNANGLNGRFFNNNGNSHGTLTNFNSVSQFGYNFIQGTTNGPGVNGATQYYSWDIGLGSEYGFAYSAQFALPRNATNPYLCVRYKDNNTYQSWQKLSAAYADSAGSIAYSNVTGTPDLTVYATITNLNTKENALTFSAPLTRTSNTISLDLSSYDTIALRNTALASYLTTATASTTYATITNLNTKENALTFSAPLTRTTNTISLDLSSYDTIALRNTALSSYLTSATASTTYATITNLNTKENALTFSAPLTRTTNTISLDLSSYATTSALTTGLAAKQATLTFSNPFLNTSNTLSLKYDNTKLSIDASGNLTVIGGTSQWTTSSSNIYYNSGNVGIGTNNPLATLHVQGPIASINSAIWDHVRIFNDGSISYFDAGGSDGIAFRIDNTSSGYPAASYSEKMRISNNGYVGIGTDAPLSRLTIRNNHGDGASGGLCLDAKDVTNLYNLRLYSFVQAGSQVGYNFQVNNISSSVNAMTLGYNGNVGIGTTSPVYKLDISGNINSTEIYRNGVLLQNHLFNNNGNSHLAINNFNSVSQFGYNFIGGTTNGPGVNGAGQYYSWDIGLGSEYGFGTYRAQFALPRNVSNPYLCVRYQENTVYQAWQKLSCGYADTANSLTSGTKTLSGALNLTGTNPSVYFYGGESALGYASTNGAYSGSANANDLVLRSTGGYRLHLQSGSGGAALIVGTNNYVGIGLSPSYPLHVMDGSSALSSFSYSIYFGILGSQGYYLTTVFDTTYNYISAYFNGVIIVGRWIAAVCDERIKRNLQDINDDTALNQILAIQPKTYNYIDVATRGNEKVIGFSAQQVKEVIPEAVKLNKDFIPNIYKVFDLSGDIITTNEDLTNILSVDDNIQIIEQTKENKGSFKILEISPTHIKIDKSIEGDKCFIYGKEVNDFHTLSKEYIFTLNVCATQELHRQIQQQSLLIQDLQNRLSILENK